MTFANRSTKDVRKNSLSIKAFGHFGKVASDGQINLAGLHLSTRQNAGGRSRDHGDSGSLKSQALNKGRQDRRLDVVRRGDDDAGLDVLQIERIVGAIDRIK